MKFMENSCQPFTENHFLTSLRTPHFQQFLLLHPLTANAVQKIMGVLCVQLGRPINQGPDFGLATALPKPQPRQWPAVQGQRGLQLMIPPIRI
jgi:hypothetical protein